MVQTVIMPKLGQTVEESTIVKWRKREGDPVAKGDILFDIETDKAVLEVESFFEGTLLKIIVGEGTTVPVTAPVAFVGQPGDPLPALAPPAAAAAPAPAATAPARPAAERPAAERPAAPARPAAIAPAAPAAPPAPRRQAVSPRARRLLRDCAVSAAPIRGTGPGGRIVEADVQDYLAARHYDALKITPAAKTLARLRGLDILAIARAPGEDRITVAMVERALAEQPKPLSKRRQVIAQRLTASFSTTPHFYVTVAADLTDLLDTRQQLQRGGLAISITDCILKATATALTEFPPLNSATDDGRTVRWHSAVHLGIAVAVPDGLLVPVLRDAQALALADVHAQAAALVLKAREGRLTPDEMAGSTFTVSNMGMLGVAHFTAIINPGESGILAVSSVLPTPVVRRDAIVVRQMMNMTLSSDHRLVDGATAAQFVNRIKALLEDPRSWIATT